MPRRGNPTREENHENHLTLKIKAQTMAKHKNNPTIREILKTPVQTAIFRIS
jgi:hypothetical protein